jgi:hypothetical protein
MINLNVDPGEGNLNVRAYLAAIVGPRRVAHGQRFKRNLQVTQPVQVAKNSSRNSEAFFVSAWLPEADGLPPGVGYVVAFSSSETTGDTADVVTLGTVPGQAINHYSAVLLPDDQLYASVVARTDGAALAAGLVVPLIVSQVAF